MASDDEDDYLAMTFEDSTTSKQNETLTQKKRRLMRESEARSRPKSKAELAAEEELKRNAALSTPAIDQSSKAFRMMAALGYKPGQALGKETTTGTHGDDRLREPIVLDTKDGRSGIGADSEKKRKFREEVERQEQGEKRQRVDAEDFRIRQQQEREAKRTEAQFWAAMKTAERLEDGDDEIKVSFKLLRSVNVLWRGSVKARLMKDRENSSKTSLHKLAAPDAVDDQYTTSTLQLEEAINDLDDEDDELDAFEALPPAEKLRQVVEYMRDKHSYCFWCKHQYADSQLEGCPGIEEVDHD